MTDDTDELPMNPGMPQGGQLHPALEALRQQFNTDGGQEWINKAVVDVQQHLNERNVADANAQAGAQFVNNLAQTKDNLIGLVQSDPTAAHLAMGLVPDIVGALVHHGGVPEDQRDDAHADLTDHMQGEIARAAVQRMAEFDAGRARSMLDTFGDHFDDGQRGVVSHYIDTMDAARTADAETQQQQAAQRAAQQSQSSALVWGSLLADPRSGQVSIPPNYLQDLVASPTVAPADKRPLFAAFNGLRQNGDAPSDPLLLSDLAARAASGDANFGDVFQHVGSRLSLADAHTLASGAIDPLQRPQMQSLADTLGQARRFISPNNDAAEVRAYGRFVNWLMPSLRSGGSLDPRHDAYVFGDNPLAVMSQFQPRGDDLMTHEPPADRPSLSDIFGGRRA